MNFLPKKITLQTIAGSSLSFDFSNPVIELPKNIIEDFLLIVSLNSQAESSILNYSKFEANFSFNNIDYKIVQEKFYDKNQSNLKINDQVYNSWDEFCEINNIEEIDLITFSTFTREDKIDESASFVAYSNKNTVEIINQRIKEVEKQIEEYRSKKQELNKIKTNFNYKVSIENNLFNKIKSVDFLNTKLTDLQNEISKYKNVDKNQVKEIKARRLTRIFEYLQNIRVTTSNPLHIISQTARDKFEIELRAVEFSILAILQIVLTTYIYLKSFNSLIILISLASIFINGILYFLYSKFKYIQPLVKNQTKSQTNTINQMEDTLIINSAWLDALNREFYEIDQSSRKILDGMSITEAKQKLANISKDIDVLEKAIKAEESTILPKEKYLEARREYDLLKVNHKSAQNNSNLSLYSFILINDNIDEYLNKFKEFQLQDYTILKYE